MNTPERHTQVTAPGRRLAVDVGSVRVGVALSDPHAMLAMPQETLARDVAGGADLDALVRLVTEHDVTAVVVGLPLNMNGSQGPAAELARDYAGLLAQRLAPSGVPVRLVDERLSTVSASKALTRSGRSSRRGRGVIDQVAAVVFLQSALDRERATGLAAGELVEPAPAREAQVNDVIRTRP